MWRAPRGIDCIIVVSEDAMPAGAAVYESRIAQCGDGVLVDFTGSRMYHSNVPVLRDLAACGAARASTRAAMDRRMETMRPQRYVFHVGATDQSCRVTSFLSIIECNSMSDYAVLKYASLRLVPRTHLAGRRPRRRKTCRCDLTAGSKSGQVTCRCGGVRLSGWRELRQDALQERLAGQ